MEFSQLGFIGKLFKCNELPMFVNFFLVFANDKPVDWLFDIMLNVKICNPEKGQVNFEKYFFRWEFMYIVMTKKSIKYLNISTEDFLNQSSK